MTQFPGIQSLIGRMAGKMTQPFTAQLPKPFIKFADLVGSRSKLDAGMQQTQRPAEPSVPDRDERPVLPKTARRADAADSDLETAATREVGEQPAHDRPALDPLELALSRPTLPGLAVPAPFVESVPRATAWVDPMVAEIVQSLAWGGDRRRGAARIELSGKKLGGASVVVHAEDGELTLELTAPAHVNALELGERLKERLERRGFAIRSLSAR